MAVQRTVKNDSFNHFLWLFILSLNWMMFDVACLEPRGAFMAAEFEIDWSMN
jgi:hypothetical protein